MQEFPCLLSDEAAGFTLKKKKIGGRGGHSQVFGQRCGDLATRWRSQPLVLVPVPENLVILTQN